MNQFILQEDTENIHIIKINRAPNNFIKLPVLEELGNVLETMGSYPVCEGLILTSALDNIFVSGHEIADLGEEHNDRKLRKYTRLIAEVLLSIQRLHIPTLTLINGHCVGFGLELALCTDFRIACDEDITIGFPDIRLGTFPPFGGIYRLVQLIGETRAKELLLKGRLLKPQAAVDWGLIDGAFGRETIMDDARKMLKGISRHASLAMTAIKRSIVDSTLKDFLSVVQEDLDDYATILHSHDYAEGKKAIEENRSPVFRQK